MIKHKLYTFDLNIKWMRSEYTKDR